MVGRFLAEYLSSKFWNGTDFFLEIMKLLSYLPITSISGKFAYFLTTFIILRLVLVSISKKLLLQSSTTVS